MNTKLLLSATAIAILAIALTLNSATSAVMAKHKSTQTFDNVKKIVVSNGKDIFIVNVNSVPGPAGKNGLNSTVPGPAGPPGANSTVPGPVGPAGKNGSNGTSIVGPMGPPGKNGENGTTTVVICTNNSTNPLCQNTPAPPVNTTNTTK